ncbi:DUF3043 domain-containing protein [Microbacterium sp. P06]|uniref:DUF3043 domain-containing protein n=1 Tax=unclassified Microbacterium TaxID=2609290 RepID=UPI0037456EE1
MAKTPAPASNEAPEEALVPGGGKGRATPSRAEQEAARKRPLVADTKEARARARAELAVARERARAGMAAGEDKFLPLRDKGPQRRFARDWVDAGWHLGEALMPMAILVILLTLVPNVYIQYGAYPVLMVFVLLVVGDMLLTARRIKKEARKKFGEARVEKGLGFYSAMRTVQMRFMRLPKPQVKRGGYPV